MSEPAIHEASLTSLPAAAITDVCELKAAIWRELVPSDPPMTPAAAISDLRSSPAQSHEYLVVANLAGRVVGIGTSHRPTTSANANLLTVSVDVHPNHRRAGIGRLLLAALISEGRNDGCDSVLGWGPRTDAANGFWEAVAMPEVLRSSRSRAAIAAIDANQMAQWQAAESARSAGYQVRSFVGACPDSEMGLYTAAQNAMQDSPSDGMEQEWEPLDKTGVRLYEARLAERGGTGHVILAVDPNGNAAGITEVVTFDHTPEVVFQQTTATVPAHRRQGLGRWLKAEMYRHITEQIPQAQLIETGNADSNAPILALNADMGFTPFLTYTIRQSDIATVEQQIEASKHR